MSDTDVRYPEVKVELTGRDGNAFIVLGTVAKELRTHGVAQSEIDEFYKQSTAGDYAHLLDVCSHWVNIY